MSIQNEQPDAIVIGSGPSGICAARKLVEGGRAVLMLDAGDYCPITSTSGALADLRRRGEESWPLFLGHDLDAVRATEESSPKLRTPRLAKLREQYLRALQIESTDFVVAGAFALGGLSNFWGASASAYSPADLGGYPPIAECLVPQFDEIARRIGISGRDNDDLAEYHGPLPLDGDLPVPRIIELVLDRYERRRSRLRPRGFVMGRARNAVLASGKTPLRQGCTLDNLCLWGCPRGAIYSSAFDLAELAKFPNFRLEKNCRVKSLMRTHHSWTIEAEQEGRELSFRGGTVLLAAGTLSTTRLVLGLAAWHDRPVQVLTNPVFAAAFFLPSFVGTRLSERGFAMAQLQYVLEEPGAASDYAAGALYLADGLPASEFIGRLHLTRPAARAVTRAMMPAMVLATCYLSSDYSNNWMTLRRDGTLEIKGGFAPQASERARLLHRRLRSALRGLGLFAVPGETSLTTPGSDFRYAGTLPMGGVGTLATTTEGELAGARDLYVVDAACLPRVPAKPPTLTAMANAARIADGILRRA